LNAAREIVFPAAWTTGQFEEKKRTDSLNLRAFFVGFG